jgi:hypothetical protein
MGASRPAVAALAWVPLARSSVAALLLHEAECDIRTSTVLGSVGAGGMGQELAGSLELFRDEQLATLVPAGPGPDAAHRTRVPTGAGPAGDPNMTRRHSWHQSTEPRAAN